MLSDALAFTKKFHDITYFFSFLYKLNSSYTINHVIEKRNASLKYYRKI